MKTCMHKHTINFKDGKRDNRIVVECDNENDTVVIRRFVKSEKDAYFTRDHLSGEVFLHGRSVYDLKNILNAHFK